MPESRWACLMLMNKKKLRKSGGIKNEKGITQIKELI